MTNTQAITVKVEQPEFKIAYEYQPQALRDKWEELVRQKIELSLMQSGEEIGDLSDLTSGILIRTLAVFRNLLIQELEMFTDIVMLKAVTISWQEINNRTVEFGATTSDVRHLDTQLRKHLEAILIQASRHLCGEPSIGRPPASPREREQKKNAFIQCCVTTINQLQAAEQRCGNVDLAQRLYPRQSRKAAKTSLSKDLNKYNVKFNWLQAEAAKKRLAPNCF
jgi:hypothetical protein